MFGSKKVFSHRDFTLEPKYSKPIERSKMPFKKRAKKRGSKGDFLGGSLHWKVVLSLKTVRNHTNVQAGADGQRAEEQSEQGDA